MTLSQSDHARLEAEMQRRKDAGEPFAMATVVRTVDATSARPGGKALIDADGQIVMGWVGGGCARGAVGRAARDAIAAGAPQFISLRPQDVLEDEGLSPGELRDGVRFARNGCPSRGTVDIFVEPVLPLPEVAICGTSLVAMALADLAARFDFKVTRHAAPGNDSGRDGILPHFDIATRDYVVVATQGAGDKNALRAAVSAPRAHVAFVGSRRKFAALSDQLRQEDAALAPFLDRVRAPAGLNINAITPDEIALSILAEITQMRRASQIGRGAPDG